MPDRAETTVEGMQVCRNGHVITERLTSHPEQGRSHCEQCGSVTLDGCPTCGRRFVGADHVPGLIVVGSRPAPLNCTACGAPFPWAAVAPVEPSSLAELTTFLRRLPATIRSLRSRRGTQPPYRIENVTDLEDLVYSLLPLHAPDVRSRSRTPLYSTVNRLDFWLPASSIALTVKLVESAWDEAILERQLAIDRDFYAQAPSACTLVVFLFDPLGRLRQPERLETILSRPQGTTDVHCIIAG